MLNNVSLVGRLTKDPEVKPVGENQVCNFTLAVNRDYKNKDGEIEADFIQCTAWGTPAKFIGSYVSKGQLVSVTGRIQSRTYEKDGITRYITEVNVNSVQSLEKAKQKVSEVLGTYHKVEEVQEAWTAEWDQRSPGLDPAAKENLKKELAAKYQPEIDRISDLPF